MDGNLTTKIPNKYSVISMCQYYTSVWFSFTKKKECLIWLESPVNKILNTVPPSATIRQEYDKVEASGLD